MTEYSYLNWVYYFCDLEVKVCGRRNNIKILDINIARGCRRNCFSVHCIAIYIRVSRNLRSTRDIKIARNFVSSLSIVQSRDINWIYRVQFIMGYKIEQKPAGIRVAWLSIGNGIADSLKSSINRCVGSLSRSRSLVRNTFHIKPLPVKGTSRYFSLHPSHFCLRY